MANEEFYVGQIFEGSYPPAAAIACNKNGWYIEVIGDHRYEIKAVPPAPAPSEAEIIAQQVAELKAKLSDTDYAVIKIAEATGEEADALREKYAQIIADRKEWRKQINELENGSEQVEQAEPETQE